MEVVRKELHKLVLLCIKYIPILLFVCNGLNTVLSYFNIETEIITYLCGIGIVPLIFIYLLSYTFKFCIYHKLCLIYIFVNNVICYYDYSYIISIDTKLYLVLHLLIMLIFIILMLYLK